MHWQYSALIGKNTFPSLGPAQLIIREGFLIGFNSTAARLLHLPNIPANHPFLWVFKACWNCSFTKLGSLA